MNLTQKRYLSLTLLIGASLYGSISYGEKTAAHSAESFKQSAVDSALNKKANPRFMILHYADRLKLSPFYVGVAFANVTSIHYDKTLSPQRKQEAIKKTWELLISRSEKTGPVPNPNVDRWEFASSLFSYGGTGVGSIGALLVATGAAATAPAWVPITGLGLLGAGATSHTIGFFLKESPQDPLKGLRLLDTDAMEGFVDQTAWLVAGAGLIDHVLEKQKEDPTLRKSFALIERKIANLDANPEEIFSPGELEILDQIKKTGGDFSPEEKQTLDELVKKIEERVLNAFKKALEPTPEQKKEIASQKEKIRRAEEDLVTRQEITAYAETSANSLFLIASFVSDAKAARSVTAAGVFVSTIGATVVNFLAVRAMEFAGAQLLAYCNLYTGIAMAVIQLVQALSTGPDSTTLILDAIANLSHQMTLMEAHLDARFDRVEKQLQEIHRTLFEGIRGLHEHLAAQDISLSQIQESTNKIRDSIQALSFDMRQQFQEAEQRYILSLAAKCFPADGSTQYVACLKELANHSHWMSRPLHVGLPLAMESLQKEPVPGTDKFRNVIGWQGIQPLPQPAYYSNLTSIGQVGSWLHPDSMTAWGKVVNPHSWLESVQLFFLFVLQNPDYLKQNPNDYFVQFSAVRDLGIETKDAFKTLGSFDQKRSDNVILKGLDGYDRLIDKLEILAEGYVRAYERDYLGSYSVHTPLDQIHPHSESDTRTQKEINELVEKSREEEIELARLADQTDIDVAKVRSLTQANPVFVEPRIGNTVALCSNAASDFAAGSLTTSKANYQHADEILDDSEEGESFDWSEKLTAGVKFNLPRDWTSLVPKDVLIHFDLKKTESERNGKNRERVLGACIEKIGWTRRETVAAVRNIDFLRGKLDSIASADRAPQELRNRARGYVNRIDAKLNHAGHAIPFSKGHAHDLMTFGSNEIGAMDAILSESQFPLVHVKEVYELGIPQAIIRVYYVDARTESPAEMERATVARLQVQGDYLINFGGAQVSNTNDAGEEDQPAGNIPAITGLPNGRLYRNVFRNMRMHYFDYDSQSKHYGFQKLHGGMKRKEATPFELNILAEECRTIPKDPILLTDGVAALNDRLASLVKSYGQDAKRPVLAELQSIFHKLDASGQEKELVSKIQGEIEAHFESKRVETNKLISISLSGDPIQKPGTLSSVISRAIVRTGTSLRGVTSYLKGFIFLAFPKSSLLIPELSNQLFFGLLREKPQLNAPNDKTKPEPAPEYCTEAKEGLPKSFSESNQIPILDGETFAAIVSVNDAAKCVRSTFNFDPMGENASAFKALRETSKQLRGKVKEIGEARFSALQAELTSVSKEAPKHDINSVEGSAPPAATGEGDKYRENLESHDALEEGLAILRTLDQLTRDSIPRTDLHTVLMELEDSLETEYMKKSDWKPERE